MISYEKSLIAHLVRDEHPESGIVDCLEMVQRATQNDIYDLIMNSSEYYALVKAEENGLKKVGGVFPEDKVDGKLIGYRITDKRGEVFYYVIAPEYQTSPSGK